MKTVSVLLKFIAFLGLCLIIVPPQWLIVTLHKGRFSYILPQLWHKGACAIFGIKIERVGVPYTDSQVLYISNHVSYLDIPVLGSIIQQTSFVSKNDVANWPVWGFLSKLQQTAFISRSRKDTKKEAHSLDAMLEAKKNLVIFPEGTSTNGLEVKDFKSSLFSLALKDGLEDIVIQPITIRILTTDGKPPQKEDERNIYAWPLELDISLDRHLMGIASTSGAHIEVTFHDIIAAKDFDDRKTLAKTCHDAVCSGLEISKAA